METIILNIKDHNKYLTFLDFIKQLDFVEVEDQIKKKSKTVKYDFFASAGLWKDKYIDSKELRNKAWNRIK